MSKSEDLNEPHSAVSTSQIVKGIFGVTVFSFVWFSIAGRLNWWQGWALLLTIIIYLSILVWRLSKVNPELLKERNRPANIAEGWDQVVMRIYSVALVVLWIVSALDGGRYTWSTVPLGAQLIGWILLVAAGVMIWRVMMTNAYLSSWARIQDDRGQKVVQNGIYRQVRHPMYLGIMICFLAIPLVLGSWWAMIPSILIIGLFVYRTNREDQMLMNGLDGYIEYTKKVKYKLLPGIW
jgi:protein-S-isoprenylcysteine O-methyltransferase Ste14